jgi:hypothetical protein
MEGAIVLVDELEQGLEPHRVLGAVAVQHNWFKSEERGCAIAPAVNQLVEEGQPSALSVCLKAVEQWLYGE